MDLYLLQLALLASTTREVQDVDRLLTIMQQNNWENPPLDNLNQAPDLFRGNRAAVSNHSGPNSVLLNKFKMIVFYTVEHA